MRLAIAAALVCVASGLSSAPVTIDDYVFTWRLVTAGDCVLKVEKTPDTTLFLVSGQMAAFRVRAGDAEAIGAVLATIDTYWSRMKELTTKTKEQVKTKGFVVEFRMDPEDGFKVCVSREDGSPFESMYMDRAGAKVLTPYFQKASAFVAYADSRIKP